MTVAALCAQLPHLCQSAVCFNSEYVPVHLKYRQKEAQLVSTRTCATLPFLTSKCFAYDSPLR